MDTYRMIWTFNDTEVLHLGGSSYVQADTSARAKVILIAYIEKTYPGATDITIGYARRKDAPSPDQLITEDDIKQEVSR